MNAGAFGGETRDRLVWAEALDRAGRAAPAEQCRARLRLPPLGPARGLDRGARRLRAASRASPSVIAARMEAIKAEREAAQPFRVATGGSTFKNPPGERAWQLDRRGRLSRPDATVPPWSRTSTATSSSTPAAPPPPNSRRWARWSGTGCAATSGIRLEWEIKRLGEASATVAPAEPRQAIGVHR